MTNMTLKEQALATDERHFAVALTMPGNEHTLQYAADIFEVDPLDGTLHHAQTIMWDDLMNEDDSPAAVRELYRSMLLEEGYRLIDIDWSPHTIDYEYHDLERV